jgi:hypothetical protein
MFKAQGRAQKAEPEDTSSESTGIAICLEPALQSIGRITTTHSALLYLYLQVPGAANQVRDVRKVALVSLGCVGTGDHCVRGVPGRSL